MNTWRYMLSFWLIMENYGTLMCYCIMQIKRCGEMTRKLRFFKEQMTKAGLSPSVRSARSDDVDLDNLEVCWNFGFQSFGCYMEKQLYMWYCQVKLGELEAELMEMNANHEKLQQSYNELIEYKLVVQKVRRHLLVAWLHFTGY